MRLSQRDLENLVQLGRREGALGIEILATWSHTTSTRAARRAPAVRREEADTVSVRAWTDGGHEGRASGAQADVEAVIRAAVAAAAAAPSDPHAGPVDRLGTPARGLGIDDRRHDQLTDADRAEVVASNERAAARESAAVEAGPFELVDVRAQRLFANSRGVLGEAWGTSYTLSGGVTLRAGDRPVTLSSAATARSFAGATCLPFGQLLAQRAAGLVELAPAVDGPVRVLLPPRASGALIMALAELFTQPIGTPSLLDRTEGGQLFHRKIHLVDDGLLPGGVRTWPFDDRGVQPAPITLLREGAVDRRYQTVNAARAADALPTGHEVGPTLRPSNLLLNAGTRSINALLGEQDGLVFAVDDLPDLAGLNRVTGALDVPVHGVLLRGRTRVGARRHARLQGDLVAALRNVVAVTSDTDRIGHADAAGIFLDGLRVIG